MARLIQYRGALYRRADPLDDEEVLLLWWNYWAKSTPGGPDLANAEWLLESVQHDPVAAEALDRVRADKGLGYLTDLAESVVQSEI